MGTICRSCRRVLLFPKGNNVDHLSVYLDVADSVQLPYGWSRFAHFNLAVVNQYDPKSTVKKGLCLSVNFHTNDTALLLGFCFTSSHNGN